MKILTMKILSSERRNIMSGGEKRKAIFKQNKKIKISKKILLLIGAGIAYSLSPKLKGPGPTVPHPRFPKI